MRVAHHNGHHQQQQHQQPNSAAEGEVEEVKKEVEEVEVKKEAEEVKEAKIEQEEEEEEVVVKIEQEEEDEDVLHVEVPEEGGIGPDGEGRQERQVAGSVEQRICVDDGGAGDTGQSFVNPHLNCTLAHHHFQL